MKLEDSRECINTQLLEGSTFYSCRFLESQRFGLWTPQRTDASRVKLQISWGLLKSLHITSQSLLSHFTTLENRECCCSRRSGRSSHRRGVHLSVCACVDLWLPCLQETHVTGLTEESKSTLFMLRVC